MEFSKAASAFIDHLRIERGLSINSIAAYSRDLSKYLAFLQANNFDYATMKNEEILNFEVFLKGSKISQSSINRNLSALRSFYRYCALEFDVPNPTLDIERSATPRRLPKALSVAQITAMIESTVRPGEILSIRDRAILELLYSSGARVSEIVGIALGDLSVLHIDGRDVTTLKLRGKGSKERIVPLGSYAKMALDDYMVRTRPSLVEKSSSQAIQSALFLNSKGTRLSRQSAWSIVKVAAASAGLMEKVSPHVFRHSYATHLLDGGADIRVVQELLGHASVTTTQIYTLVTIDRVREAYATAHPRAR
jgi:integrase/recombinase XerD